MQKLGEASHSTKAQQNSYTGLAAVQLATGKQPSNSNTITVIDNKLERRPSSIINRYGDEESTTSGMNPVIGGGQTIVSLR